MGRRGFTLIELVVVVAIITALAAVIVPVFSSARVESQSAKILSLADSLRRAAIRYYVDTGGMPEESSDSPLQSLHDLSQVQTTGGWSGPYIDHPITRGDHPSGDRISISPYGIHIPLPGGLAPPLLTNPLCALVLSGISGDVAAKVDEALDGAPPADWATSGRVRWLGGSTLRITLLEIL